MSDLNSRDVDALVTSGDERRLDSITEIERGTEGVWTPASLAVHDTLPGHVSFWKRFRRNKVAVAAAVYLVLLIVAAVLAGRIGLQDPNLQHIPVVVLSTSDASRDVERAYQLHANCYLQKPTSADEYLRTVRGIEEFWLTLAKLPPAASVWH